MCVCVACQWRVMNLFGSNPFEEACETCKAWALLGMTLSSKQSALKFIIIKPFSSHYNLPLSRGASLQYENKVQGIHEMCLFPFIIRSASNVHKEYLV